ncbi:MAG TPA: choice-of-anchor X domain-containing protein [Patescibacteria group bacterium]|nr:choice-of-anchor X domain-containing protein [Patescibacteria group bacterium]
MSKRRTGFLLSLAAAAVPFASVSAAQLATKQLAGAPSEFADMAAVEPAHTAVHSKSALLPVRLDKQANGRFGWQSTLPVEGEALRLLSFSGAKAQWDLALRDPMGGHAKSVRDLAQELDRTNFALEGQSFPAVRYGFKAMIPGDWTLSVEGDAAGEGFVLVEGAGKTRLMAHQTSFNQQVGKRLGFVASVYDEEGSDSAPQIADAKLRVRSPDGVVEYPMFDDGLHGDGKALDGLFGADFAALRAGEHSAQVIASGRTADGKGFVRSAEFALPVIADELSVRQAMVFGKAVSDRRIALDLEVSTAKASTDHYRVIAEVWGTSRDGKRAVPVAWIGGMSQIESGRLPLSLDARWIAKAQAVGPFTLRNLRIEDPNHFIPLAKIAELPVDLGALPKAAFDRRVAIDDEMLQGPRPADLMLAKGVGKRLLLVHGYCSGDAWGPVAYQFGTASVFKDFNKNRTHDQFANLIKTFGSTWNSFGVVAHSQGGAASLHLYTYYWSGLDNATGSRLIQSVGTPYQGTALAGNAAVLGSVFGVGCGTNANLTYSGASTWLAGIPSSRRAKVNYYTTSFKLTNWYTNDYCNMATDLLLNDPEDGTTEQAKGQLSGAVNQGHKTGWCHTSGMRDPAQVSDSGRNSTMNSNAAR